MTESGRKERAASHDPTYYLFYLFFYVSMAIIKNISDIV